MWGLDSLWPGPPVCWLISRLLSGDETPTSRGMTGTLIIGRRTSRIFSRWKLDERCRRMSVRFVAAKFRQMLLSAERYWFGWIYAALVTCSFVLCVSLCRQETSFKQNLYVVLSPLWTDRSIPVNTTLLISPTRKNCCVVFQWKGKNYKRNLNQKMWNCPESLHHL